MAKIEGVEFYSGIFRSAARRYATHGFAFEGAERRVLTSIIATDDPMSRGLSVRSRFQFLPTLPVSMTSIPRSLPRGRTPSLSCATVRISRDLIPGRSRRSKSSSMPRPKPARLFLVTGKIATAERIRSTVAGGGSDEER